MRIHWADRFGPGEATDQQLKPAEPAAEDPYEKPLESLTFKHKKEEPQWLMAEALFKTLHRETSASGSDLLLVYVPRKRVIYRGEGKKIMTTTDPEALNFRTIAARNGIEAMIPIGRLRERQTELSLQGKFIDKKDGHWNEEGHRVIGDMLAEYVIENCERYGLCS